MSECGREALPDAQDLTGGPPECQEVVERHSRMFGSDRETLSNVRDALPNVREW